MPAEVSGWRRRSAPRARPVAFWWFCDKRSRPGAARPLVAAVASLPLRARDCGGRPVFLGQDSPGGEGGNMRFLFSGRVRLVVLLAVVLGAMAATPVAAKGPGENG